MDRILLERGFYSQTRSARRLRVEHVGGDQLLEIGAVPPRELVGLRAPEEHLLVVLDRERDAAPDLGAHPRRLAVGLAAEELRHRGQPGDPAAPGAGPRRLAREHAAAVD